MPTAKEPAAKKMRFAMIIPRHQLYCFEVEARSPEEACKTLWRKLRLDKDPLPPAGTKMIGSQWGNPKQPDCRWLVTSDLNGEIFQEWNGKEFIRVKFP